MNKDEFLKKLKKYLRYLNNKERLLILQKYENINNYNDLDPVSIANKVYEEHNSKIRITKEISLFNAVNVIINKLRLKNKDITKNILLFFLYLLIILVAVKIPFIYIRDVIGSFFEISFMDNNNYAKWQLIFEFAYAITAILILIRIIKKKAVNLETME